MGDDCLETRLARATSCLGSTSADWERRVAGLREISDLAHEICEAPDSDVILHGLHSVLACQICDRRSAVAREALECVAVLTRTCTSRAERLVAQLHPSIMAALATSMAVVTERAEQAMQVILDCCPSRALVFSIVAVATRDKNVRLRCAATSHLLRGAKEWEESLIENVADLLRTTSMAAIVDAGDDTRRLGRELFAVCAQKWPQWAVEAVARTNDRGLQRRLQGYLSDGRQHEDDILRSSSLAMGQNRASSKTEQPASHCADAIVADGENQQVIRSRLGGSLHSGAQRLCPRPANGQTTEPSTGVFPLSIADRISRENADPNVVSSFRLTKSPQKIPTSVVGLVTRQSKATPLMDNSAPLGVVHNPAARQTEKGVSALSTAQQRVSKSRRSIGGNALRVALARSMSLDAAQEGSNPGGDKDESRPASARSTPDMSVPSKPYNCPPIPLPLQTLLDTLQKNFSGLSWQKKTELLELLSMLMQEPVKTPGTVFLVAGGAAEKQLANALCSGAADVHARVACTSLKTLAVAFDPGQGWPRFPASHLETAVGVVFTRLVDVKEGVRQASSACLESIARMTDPDRLCLALSKVLSSHKSPRVRSKILAFLLDRPAFLRHPFLGVSRQDEDTHGGSFTNHRLGVEALLARVSSLLLERLSEIRHPASELLRQHLDMAEIRRYVWDLAMQQHQPALKAALLELLDQAAGSEACGIASQEVTLHITKSSLPASELQQLRTSSPETTCSYALEITTSSGDKLLDSSQGRTTAIASTQGELIQSPCLQRVLQALNQRDVTKPNCQALAIVTAAERDLAVLIESEGAMERVLAPLANLLVAAVNDLSLNRSSNPDHDLAPLLVALHEVLDKHSNKLSEDRTTTPLTLQLSTSLETILRTSTDCLARLVARSCLTKLTTS